MTSFKWQNLTKFRRAMKEHSVKKLVKKLSTRNRHTWDKVSGALINTGSLAVEPLTVVLKDKVNNTYYVRERAAFILGKIGDPRATESLIEAMGDISDNVCISATWALGKIGDKNAVEPLIDSLNNSNEVVRCSAANALGMIGDQISIQPLIRALKDSDGNVRSSAAEALGMIGDPCAVPHLIDAMKDDFLSYNSVPGRPEIPLAIVCGSAVEALGKTGGPDVKEHLVSALKDKYPNVRDSAARALGWRGDIDAVYVLIEAMKTDDNEFVRKSAADALGRIGNPDALESLISVSEDTDLVSYSASRAIDNIMKSNKKWQLYFPRLLCSKCFMKTVKKQIVRYGILKIYTVIVCRGCNSWVHLKNAKRIIGVIGAKEDFYVSKGNAYVSLWSEQQKKARNADIDVLEIRDSEGINYDYAINAVLITLKNDVSRPGEYVKELPVVIHGNPGIPEGSRIILEHEFGKIEKQDADTVV
ncbi:MAG: hypothetical protein GY795_37950 [Desulfobacterales bacterium]|nr:hypothetical protein [Desulfobacterales bacterium]